MTTFFCAHCGDDNIREYGDRAVNGPGDWVADGIRCSHCDTDDPQTTTNARDALLIRWRQGPRAHYAVQGVDPDTATMRVRPSAMEPLQTWTETSRFNFEQLT